MCSDNVFTIIVWDFIKIARKVQKLQLITMIYLNEKSVKFQKLWLLQNWGVTLNQSLDCSNIKNKMMQVLFDIIRSAVIT